MHTSRIQEAARRWALTGLTAGLVVLSLLPGVIRPDSSAAATRYHSPDATVTAIVDPPVDDGVRGWRGTLTRVQLVPRTAGDIYYCWDQPIGVWKRADGPLVVPEGKHTLHATLVTPDGARGPLLDLPFKVDYDTPVRAPATVAPLAATTSASGSVTVKVTVNPHPGARVIRIGGADRYETSQLISEQNFASASTVIVATGATFADALAASGLSGCLNAPIVLTRPGALPAAASAEIARLGASKAIIVGGTLAVSPAVAGQLSGLGLEVERIGGPTRYETAALIAERVMQFHQYGWRVFIARGDDFADALSLGPLVYQAKAPLLLVRPTVVPDSTRALLSASAFSSGCIAGGTAAVSPGVESEIRLYVPNMQRLAGATRYSTAVAVASWGVSSGLSSYRYVGVATGRVFADALCGGAGIGSRQGVILLTTPDALSPECEAVLAAQVRTIEEVQVFGGERAVYPVVFDRIKQILQ